MGTQLPLSQRAQLPILGPYLLWPNGCMEQDATWYGGKPRPRRPCISLSPGDFVLAGGPSHLPQKGRSAPIFGLCLLRPNGYMDQDATWYGGSLGSDDIVLHEDPAPTPHKRGHSPPPQFSAHFYCGQTAGCIKMPLGMEVGLSPDNFVVDGDPAPSPKRGGARAPNSRPTSIVVRRLHGSRCHLVQR